MSQRRSMKRQIITRHAVENIIRTGPVYAAIFAFLRVRDRHVMLAVSRWFRDIFHRDHPLYLPTNTTPSDVFASMRSPDGDVQLSTLIERLVVHKNPPYFQNNTEMPQIELFRPHNMTWTEFRAEIPPKMPPTCACEVCLVTRTSCHTARFSGNDFGFGGDIMRAILVPEGIPQIEIWCNETHIFTKDVDHTRRVVLSPTEMIPITALCVGWNVKPHLATLDLEPEHPYRYQYLLLKPVTRQQMVDNTHLGIYEKYR